MPDSTKLMRILVLFDLPRIEKEEMKIANKFLRELRKLGFYKYQYSVYTRNVRGYSALETKRKEVVKICPKRGRVTIITLTDMQFNSRTEVITTENRTLEKYEKSKAGYLDFGEDDEEGGG